MQNLSTRDWNSAPGHEKEAASPRDSVPIRQLSECTHPNQNGTTMNRETKKQVDKQPTNNIQNGIVILVAGDRIVYVIALPKKKRTPKSLQWYAT